MKIPISLLLTLFQGMILVDGAISPSRDDASVLMDAPVSPNVASHGNATRIPPFGNFIIGGTAAAEGVFPYMAIMELTPGYVHCGGVMISPTWFLTASHCFKAVEGKPFNILVGSTKRGSMPIRAQAKKYVTHPSYVTFSGWDVALVEIASPVYLPSYARILPGDSGYFPLPYTALGWGLNDMTKRTGPDRLQQVRLMPGNPRGCDLAGGPYWEDNGFLCAGEMGRDACFGDSGGPLLAFSPQSGTYGVVALTSFGANSEGEPASCGGASDLGFYWNLTPAIPWILQWTGIPPSFLVLS